MIGTPAEPTADYIDSHADSRVWKHFRPRAGDIVVATPPKSGTTWMQAIVALLLSGDPTINVNPSHNAPWIDAASDVDEVMARIEAQNGRRHFKTHTPFDGIPAWPGLKYICVYRHPLDVFFSWRKHERNMTFEFEDLPVIINGMDVAPLLIDGRRMIDKDAVPRYEGIGLSITTSPEPLAEAS